MVLVSIIPMIGRRKSIPVVMRQVIVMDALQGIWIIVRSGAEKAKEGVIRWILQSRI